MSGSEIAPDDFVLLLARHGPRVRAFVVTLVGYDPDTIDEILQSTLLVAWKKLGKFRYEQDDPSEELVRWVCTIARFEVLGYLRDQKRQRTTAFDEAVIEELAELQEAESDLFEARRVALVGCLQRVAPEQLEVVRMRYGVGLSMAEIAARQGRSADAVKAAMSRLRKALEKCVRSALAREGWA